MRINYYINNQEVNNPLNSKELSIELNYDKDDVSSQAVSLTSFEWGLGDSTDGNDAANLINAHRTNGLTGSVGVFEGLPFRIELEVENNIYQLFDGYLNTSSAVYDCDRIIIEAVEKGNIDWLSDVSDSVSFEYLYAQGNITNADFISVPYVLSELPNTREALLATISLTFLLETISTQLEEIIEISISLPNILEWTAVIRLVLRIIYLVSLFVILFITVQRIINLLIQKTKYHSVMRVKTLCEKGAAHFGLTFSSSIFDNEAADLVILPEKYQHDTEVLTYGFAGKLAGVKDEVVGFFAPNTPDARGYYNGTFGDLLRALKEVFNGKIIIDGSTLRFEKEDYNNSAYNYILPDVDQTDYSLNFEDLKSNYTVEFLTDLNDKNTLQNYSGTITQAITQPISVVNSDMVLMTGLQRRVIPFTRATTKNGLTSVEKVIDFLAPLIDAVATVIIAIENAILTTVDLILNTKLGTAALVATIMTPAAYVIIGAIIGKVTWTISDLIVWFNDNIYNTGIDLSNIPLIPYVSIGNSIENRDGMLSMENDFVDVPKLFLISEASTPSDTKIKSTNDAGINSGYLFANYHKSRTFVNSTGKPNGNQWKKYKADGIPFTCDDYELLRNNNRLQDADNRNGTLTTCRWNPEKQTADIDYRINEKYTYNLKLTVITPNGK